MHHLTAKLIIKGIPVRVLRIYMHLVLLPIRIKLPILQSIKSKYFQFVSYQCDWKRNPMVGRVRCDMVEKSLIGIISRSFFFPWFRWALVLSLIYSLIYGPWQKPRGQSNRWKIFLKSFIRIESHSGRSLYFPVTMRLIPFLRLIFALFKVLQPISSRRTRHNFWRSVEPWPDCWSLYWSWNKDFLWPWGWRQIGHCVKELVQDFCHVRDIWFFLTADDEVLSLDRDFNLFRVYFVQWKNCLPFWGSVLNLGKFWAVEKFEIFARGK